MLAMVPPSAKMQRRLTRAIRVGHDAASRHARRPRAELDGRHLRIELYQDDVGQPTRSPATVRADCRCAGRKSAFSYWIVSGPPPLTDDVEHPVGATEGAAELRVIVDGDRYSG